MNDRRGRPGYRAPGAPAGGAGNAGGPPGNAGARGALLLAVAVILGIVLLQQFDSDIDTGGQVATDAGQVDDDDDTTTTAAVGLTTVPPTTPTTAAVRPKSEVRVLVANGAGVRGLGAATTTVLRNLGYATLTPTDATVAVEKTGVQFAEGFQAEAREVAAALSLPATAAIPMASPPVAAADLGDAKVIVILGTDVSSSTSTTVAGGAGTTTTTTRG